MTTTTPHPASPAPAAAPLFRRTSSARRALAALAAGSLLSAVLGLSAPVVASAAVPVDWTDGYPGTTQTSTVSSDPATSAESKGVALIDTVLTDGEAAGTGIVLTSDGQVLTNYHVVEGSTSVKVTIASTGKTYTATVVGHDQTADVALLQLKGASGLTVAKIDTDTVTVGQRVVAVGNAGGTGSLSAASGKVSDLSASITTESEGTVAGEKLSKLIETSADVVPGDSGGPLLDSQHEVVGIDTAASSGQEIDGYAVPIATALAVVTQIRSGAETAQVQIGPAAFLGVEVAATSTANDSGYGYGSGYGGRGGYGNGFGGGYSGGYGGSEGDGSTGSSTTSGSGATIAGVVDGDAAADAGLAAGDTITKVGSTTVTDASDLTTALTTMNPGDHVTVTWTTADGQTQSASLTLDASPVN